MEVRMSDHDKRQAGAIDPDCLRRVIDRVESRTGHLWGECPPSTLVERVCVVALEEYLACNGSTGR